MSAETIAGTRPAPRLRADRPELEPLAQRFGPWVLLAALAAGFVLVGGGNLDLGPIEAKLGLSASAGSIGPFGQVCGGWEPGIWPAQVAPSLLWAWGEGGFPTVASVRWPGAIAGVLIGFLLARRLIHVLGVGAGALFGLCWFGSVALIDRSAATGIDLIAGLATIATLDRLLSRGSDLVAGIWASLAFLAGGWPPLVLIALATVVIGRHGATLSARLLVPPFVTAVVWSGWAISESPVAWGAALALPLTRKSAWLMGLGVIALGLPWSPFAALAASRTVRAGWSAPGRSLVLGWVQLAGASVLVGTVVPGLASAAQPPALAGLAIASAACLGRIWSGALADNARRPVLALVVQTCALWSAAVFGYVSYLASWDPLHHGRWIIPAALALPLLGMAVASLVKVGPRRAFLSLSFQMAAAWVTLVLVRGSYLAGAVPYYRGLSIVLIGLALPLAAVAVASLIKADARRALAVLVMVTICLKIGHWGYYIPEWNYRFSQGPWGRAVGQWVLPRWPIYTTHAWPPDLAFAIGRPVRQLADPRLLAYQSKIEPKFVLLLDNEFEYWPREAPTLIKVATFQDERGQTRILARTAGDSSWRRLAQASREE